MGSVGNDIANAAKNKAKNTIKQGVKKAFKALLKTPYGKIALGIIAISILIIIIITAIIGNSETDTSSSDSDMYTSSDEGFEQLVRWNGYMEHGVDIAKYNKDYYEFLSDGYGGVAILGLDTRWFSDHFVKLGYSTSVGSKVPKDVVEDYYREVLRDMYEEVKANVTSNGCNMTEYQLYALTARRYNWGKIGSNTVDSYKKYWKQSRDDKLSQKIKHGDYTHKLYSECLWYPDNDGVLTGRRKEEWDLFQCGYFSLIDEWYVEPSASGGGDIIKTAEKIHKYMEDHDYVYNGVYASTFEGSKKYKACVCASFVSWVLIDCGYINTCYHDCGNLDNLLAANSKFERINKVKKVSQLKAGDILIYEDYWSGGYGRVHTEIYAGNNTIYNAGSTNALQRENPYYKDMQAELNRRPVTRVYRLKESAKTYKSGSQYVGISSGGYNAIYTSSITGKKYKEFKQNSQGYNYPSIPSNCSWSSECGTVSTLIVGSGYNSKLTLKDAADRLYATGGSTSIDGYTAYFTGKNVEHSYGASVSSMTERLKKGYVGVIHNPGYSARGHYLALLDISKDGKQVYISNPDVYGSASGGNNGATKEGWNSISAVCNAIDYVAWVKK